MAALVVLVLFATLGFVAVNLFFSDTGIAFASFRSTQALYLAEAGLQYAMQNLAADNDWSDNSDISGNMAGGSFNVHYVTKSQDSVTLKVTGTKNEVSRKFTTNVVRSPISRYGLLIGGHMNRQWAVNTELPEYYLESAPLPTLDTDYYRNIADHKITGNYTFHSGDYYGVWFIDGSVEFDDNVNIYGSLIATGNVNMKGDSHITIDAYPYPLRGSRKKYGTAFWSQSGLGAFEGDEINDGIIYDISCFSTNSVPGGAYLQLDLGACNDRDFVKVELFFILSSDYNDWTIRYSDDGATWTSVINPTLEISGLKCRYSWANVGRHRYWRLQKSAGVGGGLYTEIQFVSDLSSLPNLGTTSSGSTCYFGGSSGLGNFDGTKVNDGITTVPAFDTNPSNPGAYLLLDLGTDLFKYNKFIQASLDIINSPAYAQWDLQYYDDKYTSAWRSVYTGAGGNPVSVGKHNYSWDYNVEDWSSTDREGYYYRYWRLYKTNAATPGGDHAEVQFNAPLYPALVSNGNFIFQDATDLNVVGLVYVGADLSGNLLLQLTLYVNFTGVVIVAGNFNLQLSAFVSIVYQDQGAVPAIDPSLSKIPIYSAWQETY